MNLTPRSWLAPLLGCALLAGGVLLLGGCAETSTFADGGSADAAVDATQPDVGVEIDAYTNPCSGAPPAVTGRVLAPNGNDPVAGASVFVPRGALPGLPSAVRCESCAVAGKFAAVSYSSADGSFRLERVPNGVPFKLGIQKGYFRRVVEVTVPACGELALTAEQTTLPGKQKHYGPDDIIPRIAVVSGAWDRLEKVLDKLGVEEKTIFNGRDLGTGPDGMQALMQNLARLKSFHLLFINCGNKYENLVTSPGPARNSLVDYVRKGGRLFVTDLSYDFIEHSFPPYVDFEGSSETPKDKPEAHNAAELGPVDTTLTAEVRDEQLKAWLALPEIDALTAEGKVELLGFNVGWAVAHEVNPDLGGKVWIEGQATWAGGKGVRPLTLSYDFLDQDGKGCGRVFFSSYHTHGNAPVLLAQERVLEYLMLEMGSCIDLR